MTLTINDFYTSPFGGTYHYINSTYEFYIKYIENTHYVLGFKNNKNHTVVIPNTSYPSLEQCLEVINNFLNR